MNLKNMIQQNNKNIKNRFTAYELAINHQNSLLIHSYFDRDHNKGAYSTQINWWARKRNKNIYSILHPAR